LFSCSARNQTQNLARARQRQALYYWAISPALDLLFDEYSGYSFIIPLPSWSPQAKSHLHTILGYIVLKVLRLLHKSRYLNVICEMLINIQLLWAQIPGIR
jgi:hypothetical protein